MRMVRLILIFCCLISLLAGVSRSGASRGHAREDQHASVVTLTFFWGVGCPHCTKAKPFLEELRKRYPGLVIQKFEVMENRENIPLLMEMARKAGGEATGVPTFFVGNRMFNGFSPQTAKELEDEIARQMVSVPAADIPTSAISLPLLGRIDPEALSLPVFTVIIAGLDSFNPCAFFVLLFLLSLLIHAHSRLRMTLVGGVFVFCSGFVYFLFMAAWLNIFILIGHLPLLTSGAGMVALLIAVINIKDFFLFKKGVSLTIPDQVKPGLFERMRGLVKAGSIPALMLGTLVLAVIANTYELLCTAGFPMIFTRVLTLKNLSPGVYYTYLAFYNLVYIVPLALIVAVFTVKLESRKLSEWQGRVLKLISGMMMFCLGVLLLVKPDLLNNAFASAALLCGVLTVSLAVAWGSKRFFHVDEHPQE